MTITICEIVPKFLKIIHLEVNLTNTNIMLKKWEGFYTDRSKKEDTWHQCLRHDKHMRGVIMQG